MYLNSGRSQNTVGVFVKIISVKTFVFVIVCATKVPKMCLCGEACVQNTWGYQGYQIESSPQTWLICIIWWYHSQRLAARMMNGTRRR